MAARGVIAFDHRPRKKAVMSDIGILNNPGSLALMALILGSPGLAVGGLIGALSWRRRRVAGALFGAALGFVLWLVGWMWWSDAI
jgi:Na+/proline symporter